MKLPDSKSALPVKRQIYEAYKQRMISGELKEGEVMPSTRALAEALSVSRSTVCEAYDMLLSEGFIIAHQGAPTLVAPGLAMGKTPAVFEKPAEELPKVYQTDFQTGRPDLREFPRDVFERGLKKAASELPLAAFDYSGGQGLPALRKQISAYLFRSRGISAHADDIYVTSGATHGLHVAAEVLRETSAYIYIEDPCHTGMLRTFERKGFTPVAVPVDEEGMRTDMLTNREGSSVYVTPSHQFPLGGILPAPRRAALIRWARDNDGYIIEDDYDSEFRYSGKPVAPLYSMDPQRVIYVGTFSKMMYPALRIGFVILPRSLRSRWLKARMYTDVQNPVFEQAALADFIESRRLDRHIRRMRQIYGARRCALLRGLEAAFGNAWRPWGDAAGLHIAVQFFGLRVDTLTEAFCREQSIRISSAARYCIEKGRHEDKLLIGYSHLNEAEIDSGVRHLSMALRENGL